MKDKEIIDETLEQCGGCEAWSGSDCTRNPYTQGCLRGYGEDKHKQIEEMTKEIFNTCAWRFGNPNDYKEIINDIAEDLTKLNYQKIDKDKVVLSKEEYKRLKSLPIKIIKYMDRHLGNGELCGNVVRNCAKQLGIEIKE